MTVCEYGASDVDARKASKYPGNLVFWCLWDFVEDTS
uniref:Uncharacterized protein n=1 Tax=Arundo donax TaxID=35708 RepID=A0A0A9FV31_ARUDO